MAKRSSDPRVAYTGDKVQIRDLLCIVNPLPNGVSDPEENSFHRGPGGKCAHETCAGCPQQRYASREPGKVQRQDLWGL